jgi:hypothetical protein
LVHGSTCNVSIYAASIETGSIEAACRTKHAAARHHRVRKMKLKVSNWREDGTGLRDRDSLTLWPTPEALASWTASRCKTRDGQPRYSDFTIETTLALGMVFELPPVQSEGLLSSVLKLMGSDLQVPITRRSIAGHKL